MATTTYQTVVIVGRTEQTDAAHDATCNRCGIKTKRAIVLDVAVAANEPHRASLCPTCAGLSVAGSADLYTAERIWRRAHAIETKRRTEESYYASRAAHWQALADTELRLLREAVREQVSWSLADREEPELREAVRTMARELAERAEVYALRPTARDIMTA